MSDVLYLRATAGTSAADDGRTVDLRLVPYNQPATVADLIGGRPGPAYREGFRPGAFRAQLRAASHVWLTFGHAQAFTERLGSGVTLDEHDDALYGTFRTVDSDIGRHAYAMVRDGILSECSVAFVPERSVTDPDGTVWRTKARLDQVGLCRAGEGAYRGADVLAARTAELGARDRFAGLRPPRDPQLDARIAALVRR